MLKISDKKERKYSNIIIVGIVIVSLFITMIILFFSSINQIPFLLSYIALIIALILFGLLMAYALFRGKAGIEKLKIMIMDVANTALGKFFIVAAITGMIFLGVFVGSGIVSLKELIELENMLVELCPFCMSV